MVTDEEFEFAGQLVRGMANWSQGVTNAVIEDLEKQRDKARENFIRLWETIEWANAKIDSARLRWIIEDYAFVHDAYISEKDSKEEV